MKHHERFEHQTPDLPTVMAELEKILEESGLTQHRRECMKKIWHLLQGRQRHLERMA